MILNHREKIAAVIVVLVLALLIVDRYALTPYMAERQALAAQSESLRLKMENAQRLFATRRKVEQEWRGLLASGLKTDPAAGESQGLHALRDYAQGARLSLASLKPDHTGRLGDFQQIRLQATGSGGMSQIADFLWAIESTPLPLKINELRITSRKEGTDDLTFAISTTTVVFSPAPEVKPASRRSTAKGVAK